MENKPNIVYNKDAIHIKKNNQTIVDYYLFNEYEIHYNQIPPHSIQEWHYHQKIEEIIFVIKGQMEYSWCDKQTIHTYILKEKDLVEVKNTVHTFSNHGHDSCEFIVFRFVPDGVDKREIIKNDKVCVNKIEEE